jgi:CubicO group peptidase (beta-lactamase class C family)
MKRRASGGLAKGRWLLFPRSIVVALCCFLTATPGSSFAFETASAAKEVRESSKSAADPLAGFDEFVKDAMAKWQVPGLALGVVKDGKTLTIRCYGYRDVEHKLPVTPHTLMAIGSDTKSFTAVLLSMLVDEKKLDWDTPVRTYIPEFQLFDTYASENITARDLMTHRSGLPAHDMVWYGRHVTRKELMDRLRYLEPTATLRNRYQYNNLMVTTAGYLAERITNQSWDQLIQTRIFQPLGMLGSDTSVRNSSRSDDFAYPYVWYKERVAKAPFRNLDAIAPAGAINSNIEDMLKYIQFRMDQGAVGGRQLVSKENEMEMQSPQMATGENEDFEFQTYGLGLQLATAQGHPLISHAGGIDGFTSSMSWMPRDRIGIMILTNQSGNNWPGIVMLELYDRLLGLPHTDRLPFAQKAKEAGAAQKAKDRQELQAQRKQGTTPSHNLQDYAATYEHPAYGSMTIRVNQGHLELVFDDFVLKLKHYHYDIFEIDDSEADTPVAGLVQFQMDTKGDLHSLLIPFEASVKDIVFTRR